MLLVVRSRYPGAPIYDYWRESTIIPAVYATLGLVIATRRPRHPVGWLLMGCGLVGSLQLVTGQYAALAGPADLPGRLQAMWTASQLQITWVGLVLLLLLLFPTGRLPSPRWRPVAWSVVAGVCLSLVTQAFKPRTLSDLPGDTNPFALPAFEPVLRLLDVLGGALVFVGLFGALASLVVRLRRSRGRERQQLKWFVFVALLGGLQRPTSRSGRSRHALGRATYRRWPDRAANPDIIVAAAHEHEVTVPSPSLEQGKRCLTRH